MADRLKKISEYEWEIPKSGCMNVPCKVLASEELLEKMKQDKTIEQGKNVACLPGIYKYSIILPDGHEGYGFSIGGVAALDYEKGGISPGGIGYDINCGVRLLKTNLMKEDVLPKIKQLLGAITREVSIGLGGSNISISRTELDKVLVEGAEWAVKNNYGNKEDLLHCESQGKLKGADASAVSDKAKSRGHKQLATLGSGNHFLDIHYVDEIFDENAAKVFGLKKGQVTVMIHCGSRGLGHQVCSDYLREMERSLPEIVSKLPDRELIYAPSSHPLCKKYLSAMSAAANFAWCNRHMIGHQTRYAFSKIFPKARLDTIYDVAHNICKIENHKVNGSVKKVFMHRKGATRAFGPGNKEIPKDYQKIGQPVLIPGSMGTASYLLVGTKKAEEISFSSSAHGAGREMSRHAASKKYSRESVQKDLASKEIVLKSASWKGMVQEAPGAYKDIEKVIEVTHNLGISKKVARLIPLGVVNG